MNLRLAVTGAAPTGLVGMIALVVACEWLIADQGDRLRDESASSCRYNLRKIAASRGRADIVAVGDSQNKSGVLPRLIREVTGRTALNLGVFGGEPPTTYFHLRRLLDSGARPSAVLVDFVPYLIETSTHPNARLLAEVVRPLDLIDLAATSKDHVLVGLVLTKRLLPSCRYREDLRAVALGREAAVRYAKLVSTWRNWNVNGGAQIYPVAPPESVAASRDFERRRAIPAWVPEPTNAAYVRKVLDLADARGVPLIWVISPLDRGILDNPGQRRREAAYTEFVHACVAEHPRLTVIDARTSAIESGGFHDAFHLNRLGAAAYSRGVAEVVSGRLGGRTPPGWVDLPACPLPRGREADEDIVLSFDIVVGKETARR